MRFLSAIAAVCAMCSVSHAGFLSEYLGNGSLVNNAGIIQFDEVAGDSSRLDPGDIVTIVMDFSTVGGSIISNGTTPKSVFGIYRMEFVSQSTTGSGPFAKTTGTFKAATGANSLETFLGLQSGGTAVVSEGVTNMVTSTTGFALISSDSVNFGVGNLDYSAADYGLSSGSFSVDLAADLSGAQDFFEFYIGWNEFSYSFYDSPTNVTTTDTYISFRSAMTIQDDDDVDADAFGGLSYKATSTQNFALETKSSNLVTSGAANTYALVSGSPQTTFDGSVSGNNFQIGINSGVPEPSSLATFGIGLFLAAAGRRRCRKS
jgi:hypothetical protein